MAIDESGNAPVRFVVNGIARSVAVPGAAPLLYVLRQDLGLKGVRLGCGEGRCGACTVLVDGAAVQSCDTPLWAVEGRTVTTVEGLALTGEFSALQHLFLDEQAAQCGYCINGIVMSLTAALAADPRPDRAALLEALDERHLCRCGAHARIIAAIDRALAGEAA